MRDILILLCFFLLILPVAGQDVQMSSYPVFFHQQANSYDLMNPAGSAPNTGIGISMGNQRHGGNWKDFNTYFVTFNMDVPFRSEKKELASNRLGFRFYGDQEGLYIGTSRFYGKYLWRTKVAPEWFFAGAIEAGGFNFQAKGTYATGDRSVFGMDANVGIWLHNDLWHVGIAGNQLLNTDYTPFLEPMALKRFYTFSLIRKWVVSEELVLKPVLVYRYFIDQPSHVDFDIISSIDGLIMAGAGYHRQTGFLFYAGIENLNFFSGIGRLAFSYHTPLANKQLNINTYEFTLGYTLR